RSRCHHSRGTLEWPTSALGSSPTMHADLASECRSGYSLPRPFYTDDEIFRLDLENVFYRRWLFAGFSLEAPQPGDYFMFDLGDDSLIVVRNDDGRLRALYNTCRHRGSRILRDEAGHCGKLVCPYHQWVYDRDGRLVSARTMGADFDKGEYSLHEAHLEE